ncbi:MAG: hypothetical protein KDA74_25245, partial [Planctomycetaceae bacterium]|nr:hypothetical protein [Planctomycetaceae bacterium]
VDRSQVAGMSVRTINCLEERRIRTIGDLAQKKQSELMAIGNFGDKTLKECIECLDRLEVPHPEWKVVKRKRRRSRKKKNFLG